MKSASNRRRGLLIAAAFVALQTAAAGGYFCVEKNRAPSVHASFRFERLPSGVRALPAVDLERSDGSILRSVELRGRPVLLHFWATWCPPCRDELPELLQLAREESGIQVVAVTLDEDWPAVRQFFGGAVPTAVVRDAGAVLTESYEIGTLPDTYLIDRQGAAKLRFGGARAWTLPEAVAVLRPYIEQNQGGSR